MLVLVLFSYGCVEEFDEAINAWKESIALQPVSPDAHTSQYSPLFGAI
jgi:hypothetical protein